MQDIPLLILVFFISILTSFIGSQVGSGGTIIIPLLIFLGLPPHSAIATHKLATFFGGFSSLAKYIPSKKVQWRFVLPFIVLNVIGALIGGNILLSLDADFLAKFIGFIILIPLPFLFLGKIGLHSRKIPKWLMGVGFVLFFALSVWSGISSPGTGTLFLYMIVSFFGFTFIEANATRKIPSLLSRATLLIIFIKAGIVDWIFGIPLVTGYVIGSYIGASFAIKKGNVWVRWLLIVVVTLSSIKLIFF